MFLLSGCGGPKESQSISSEQASIETQDDTNSENGNSGDSSRN